MNFGTVNRRLGSGRRSTARTNENVDSVDSLLLSQEDKPQSHQTVREISSEAERSVGPSITSFADYSERSASQVLQDTQQRAQQLTEAHSMHALFTACSLRDDNVITSKPK